MQTIIEIVAHPHQYPNIKKDKLDAKIKNILWNLMNNKKGSISVYFVPTVIPAQNVLVKITSDEGHTEFFPMNKGYNDLGSLISAHFTDVKSIDVIWSKSYGSAGSNVQVRKIKLLKN